MIERKAQMALWTQMISSAVVSATALVALPLFFQGCSRPFEHPSGAAFSAGPHGPRAAVAKSAALPPRRSEALTGRIKDHIGRSLPGLEMEAYKLPPPGGASIVVRTISDARGGFEIPFDAGEVPECLVRVAHEGFALSEGWFSVSRSPVAIILWPGRCVRFRLVDDFGVPCNDCRIEGSLTGMHFLYSPDGSGAFRVSIPKDETDIEIDVPGTVHPILKRHLDWPARGDLDLGALVISEKY